MEASAAVDAWSAPSERAHAGSFLPLVVLPAQGGATLDAALAQMPAVVTRYLPRAGAILFRGFRVSEDADFERFVTAADPDRTGARVWLWCAVPSRGQRLLLSDRRELYRAVPASVRRRWAERALVYELRDERGRTLSSRRLAPVALHPSTRQAVWAQLEHSARAGAHGCLMGVAEIDAGATPGAPGALGASLRVGHGDGTALDELDLYEVNAAVEACRSELTLEARDVLLLDPALVAHAVAIGGEAGIAVRRERTPRGDESALL